MKLPVDYRTLDWKKGEVRAVREAYISQQDGKCYWCGESLDEPPPKRITEKPIRWSLFPKNFQRWPIHLQHCHYTGMTEGAVHMYCNAVMFQYEDR